MRREGLIANILSRNPFEVLLADKGYIGEPIFVTYKKPKNGFLTPEQVGYNRVLASDLNNTLYVANFLYDLLCIHSTAQ